jgi:hypothetical protein
MSYAFHARSVYGSWPYVSHMIHIYQPFVKLSTDLNRTIAPENKGSRHNPQPGWVICGSIPSFSPKPTIKTMEKSQASVDNWLLGLWGPCHRHAIGTFNTCSRGQPIGPLPTQPGLQPWRCKFVTYHSSTFSTNVLHFPTKGPAWPPV